MFSELLQRLEQAQNGMLEESFIREIVESLESLAKEFKSTISES